MRDINDKRTEAIHAADTEFAETIARAITEASARRAENVNAAYREYDVEHERRMTVWERGEPVKPKDEHKSPILSNLRALAAVERELSLGEMPAVVRRTQGE